MKLELYSDILSDNAEKRGEKTALIAPGGVYTYAQLNREANRFANALRKMGVKEGDRIVVRLPKDEKPIIAMFGIMKVGAVLVPVGMEYPQGRIDRIIEDSDAKFTVTLEASEGTVAYKEIMKEQDDSEPERPNISGADPCIILYTSGSMGNPKGVMQRHRAYLHTCLPYKENVISVCVAERGSVLLGVTTTTFAFFYIELCIAFAAGITYIMADLEHSRDPVKMAEYMDAYKVDVVTGTPSRILQYMNVPSYKEAVKRCQMFATGGERVQAGMPETVHEIAPDCRIFNVYTQTEATGPMIVAEVQSADTPGYAARGWKLLVVDEELNPCAPGTPGELLMAGDNVMAGYLNLPDETASKTFVIEDETYVGTGDIVVRDEAGGYRIVGRKDRQIKLRGLRMEPSEIEKVIQAFPSCRIDKAVAKVNVINGTEHLVAYYTGEKSIPDALLKAHLSTLLPSYMIPDYYMFLERFPLNQNGKIDFHQLPEIEVEKLEIVAPKDELEEQILQMSREIAEFEGFGVTTPLEEAGFTSLTYIALETKILDTFKVELKLTDLMAGGASVRTLAETIRTAASAVTDERRKLDKYPFTPQMYQFMYKSFSSDLYRTFVFSERWNDAKSVRNAFLRVINSYPYFYTRFENENGRWYQIPYDGELLKDEDVEIREGDPTEEDIAAFTVRYDPATAKRLFDIVVYNGKAVTVLFHVQHALLDHVLMENIVSGLSCALRDPNYTAREFADYFDYTVKVCENMKEPRPLPEEVLLDKPHEANTKIAKFGCPLRLFTPIRNKYRVQPADYLFSLVTQAYLEIMGKDEAVFHNFFGGRNDARYFSTAGYFPIRMALNVKRDDRYYEKVAGEIIEKIKSTAPEDDLSYRILQKKQYPFPTVNFNCIDALDGNEDVRLESLKPKDITDDPETRIATPQLDFLCYIMKDVAAILLNYDESFISENTANAILQQIIKIAVRNLETLKGEKE